MSDYTPSKPTRVRMNPSRSTCEEIIRRILMTENKENGSNQHFKTAADFMAYFESLYPPGAGLTKQVQRAIKSMNLAKDENGYFLIDKTKDVAAQEEELSAILQKTNASIVEIGLFDIIFLSAESTYRSYLLTLLSETKSIRPLYITIAETTDGLLFLTEKADDLKEALSRLL